MTHRDDLHLNEFAAYIRREAALKWAAWGLIAGLAVAVLLAAGAWTLPVMKAPPRAALSLAIAALGTLVAFLTAYLYPRSSMAIARESDARMGLRARLATALEIRAGQLPVPPELAGRQWADAQAAAERADPSRAFKPRFPRRQALLAAALLAMLVVGFLVPNPQEARIAQREAERAATAEQIARLAELREEIAADPHLSQEDQDVLLHELDETLRDLREGELSVEEAVARLSEMEGELQALLSEDTQALDAALREAGRQAAQSDTTGEVGQAMSQGAYADAARALDALGEELSSDQIDAATLGSTAAELEAMAGALAEHHPELAQALRDAAEAMRAGDLGAAREALGRATDQMHQAGQQVAASEATARALGQIQEARRAIAQSGQGRQGTPSQDQGQGEGQGQPGQGQSGGQGQSPGQAGSGSGYGDASESGSGGTPGSPGGPPFCV